MSERVNRHDLEIRALESEADWRVCRERLLQLETQMPPQPWTSWKHVKLVRELAFPHDPFWLLLFKDQGVPFAACVYRCDRRASKLGHMAVLRSLDWLSGSLPPVWAVAGRENEAAERLAECLPELGRVTGCHLLCHSQVMRRDGEGYIAALQAAGRIHSQRSISFSQVIEVARWVEKTNIKKRRQNMRRFEKKLQSELALEARFVRHRGDVMTTLKDSGLWEQFNRLHEASWQTQYQTRLGTVHADPSCLYMEKALESWSRKGWLDLCAYLLGDKLAAVYLNLAVDGYVWLLQTFFDREFEDYGVGSSNLLRMILDSSERGDRALDFGGEAIAWKRRWSTHEEPVLMIEAGLTGVKGRLWNLRQWCRNPIDGIPLERLHRVHNRNEFKQATSGEDKPHKPDPQAEADRLDRGLVVQALETEADWLAVRKDFEGLEKHSRPNPWHLWEHAFSLWKTFLNGTRCWYVALPMPAGRQRGMLAAAIWREETVKRGGLNMKTLRSLDGMSMGIVPFLADCDLETLACHAMADALPTIAQRTGADMLNSYRLDGERAEAWMRELSRRGISYQMRVFTQSQRARFDDDFENYFKGLSRNIRKSLRYRLRRIEREREETPEFVSLRGKPLDHPEMASLWDEFEALRGKSWQVEEADKQSEGQAERVMKHYREAARHWAERGWLHLTLLRIEGRAVAGSAGIVAGGRTYGLLTVYDREFSRFGVGQLVIHRFLSDCHEAGDRLVEMGGEGSDWKADWATEQAPIYQIEMALKGPKAALWRLVQWRKKNRSEGPLR